MNKNIEIYGTLTLIVVALLGTGILFEYSKTETTLKKDDVVLGKYKWFIEAERTYINKNSWYRTNIMCPRIIANGGYETSSRCYYAIDTFESLKRSIIKTTLEVIDNNIIRKTPFFAYGATGNYAGYLIETSIFINTTEPKEFPKEYLVNWQPTDTRRYKLIWRVYDIKDQPYIDGIYHDCSYNFGELYVGINNCEELDFVEISGDKANIYFNKRRNNQLLDLIFIDPPIPNITKDLVLYLNLSNTDADSSGYGHSTVTNTITYNESGYIGTGGWWRTNPLPASFLEYGTSDWLDGMQNLTINLWINPQDYSCRMVHMNGVYSYIIVSDEDEPRWRIYNRTGSTYEASPAGSGHITFNKWQMLTATYNGDTGNMTIYINGTALSSAITTRTGGIRNLSVNLYIGIDEDESTYRCTGIMDEISIYRRALIQEDIDLLMDVYKNGSTPLNYTYVPPECTNNSDCELCEKCVGDKCTNQTDSEDLKNECGAITCGSGAGTPYYYGWDGLTCYYRENASAAVVNCSGDGSCQIASDVCPYRPIGDSIGVTCSCEAAKIGCSGTTIGSCDNGLCSKNLYINQSHPNCNDDNTRDNNTIDNPFCDIGRVNYAISGDTVYIARGIYNANVYLQNKNYDAPVTITAYPGDEHYVVMTRIYSTYNTTPNNCWINWSMNGLNLWRSNSSACYVNVWADFMMYHQNGTMLYPYDNFQNFSNPALTWDTSFDASFGNDSDNEIWVRFNSSTKNPNNMKFLVPYAYYGTFRVQNKTGALLTIANISITSAMYTNVYLIDVSNITLDNLYIRGGKFGVRGLRSAGTNQYLTIKNSRVNNTVNPLWAWMAVKNYAEASNLETTGIHLNSFQSSIHIYNNNITNWFNGILTENTVYARRLVDSSIYNNIVQNIFDDAIEPEYFVENLTIYNNTVYDSFVGLSMAPLNSSSKQSKVYNNIFHSDKLIRWDKTAYQRGECYKVTTSNAMHNINLTKNTCYGRGVYSATTHNNPQLDTNWQNNLFYQPRERDIIYKSGTAARNVFYNYNLYYSDTTARIFYYWNNDTGGNALYSLSEALASKYWDGTWDVNSVEGDPNIMSFIYGNQDFMRPYATSPACNAASDNTTIGAVPCSDEEPPATGVTSVQTILTNIIYWWW